jgi:septal ring factor EnvC (AmiA/AmiB activator)
VNAGEIIGWALGGGGIGKMAYDMVRARSDARKVDTASAKTLIAVANDSANEWQKDLAEIRAEVRELRAANRAQDRRITAHLRWDNQVAAKLRALGEEISDPPPLYAEEV